MSADQRLESWSRSYACTWAWERANLLDRDPVEIVGPSLRRPAAYAEALREERLRPAATHVCDLERVDGTIVRRVSLPRTASGSGRFERFSVWDRRRGASPPEPALDPEHLLAVRALEIEPLARAVLVDRISNPLSVVAANLAVATDLDEDCGCSFARRCELHVALDDAHVATRRLALVVNGLRRPVRSRRRAARVAARR